MNVNAATFEELAALIEPIVAENPELKRWWAELDGKGGWTAYPVTSSKVSYGFITPTRTEPRPVKVPRDDQRTIHIAYNAMLRLEDERTRVRVRSRAGLELLLRAAFNIPVTRPVVHWAWPAATTARAHRARVWL